MCSREKKRVKHFKQLTSFERWNIANDQPSNLHFLTRLRYHLHNSIQFNATTMAKKCIRISNPHDKMHRRWALANIPQINCDAQRTLSLMIMLPDFSLNQFFAATADRSEQINNSEQWIIEFSRSENSSKSKSNFKLVKNNHVELNAVQPLTFSVN